MKKKDIIIALVEANLAERAQALEANHALQRLLSKAHDDLTFQKELLQETRGVMHSRIDELRSELENARQGEPK